MNKIAFITLGCDKNLVDAEVALGKLLSGGYNFFSSPEEAEILILNTCAFIEEACQETEDWIKKLSRLIPLKNCWLWDVTLNGGGRKSTPYIPL